MGEVYYKTMANLEQNELRNNEVRTADPSGFRDASGKKPVKTMIEVLPDESRGIPEITPEQEAVYTDFDPNKLYAVACGDDRYPTEESLALLPDGVEKDGTLVRYYGGIWGVSRVLAVAIAQQYGIDALKEHYHGDFVEFACGVRDRIEATTNLRFTVHSAEANEDGAKDTLNESSEKGVGCAYADSIGGVSQLNSDPTVRSIASEEARQLSQAEVDQRFDEIVAANQVVFNLLFEDNAAASLSREDFLRTAMPSLILVGAHRHITDGVKAVANLRDDKVSNPRIAEENGGRFYNNDIAIIAKAVMTAFSDLKLNPHWLLDIMVEDIAATRQALAGREEHPGHNEFDAADLIPARYGSFVKALRKLEEHALTVY